MTRDGASADGMDPCLVLRFLADFHYSHRCEISIGGEDVFSVELASEGRFLNLRTRTGSLSLMGEICSEDSVAIVVESYVAPI